MDPKETQNQPAPSPPEAAEPTPKELEGNPFEALADEISRDDDSVEAEAPPVALEITAEAAPAATAPAPSAPPAKETPPTPVVPDPAATPPPTQPAVVTAPVTPPATPPAQPTTPPVAPPAPAPTPEAQQPPAAPAPDMKALREQAVSELTKVYAIPEEDIPRIMTEPETVLPRLMAQMHANIYEAAVQTVVSQLPQIMQMVTTRETESAKAKSAFFERWPDLAPFEQELIPMVQTYRALNPGAPVQTLIEQVGASAMFMKGLVPADGAPPAPAGTPFTPATAQGGRPAAAPNMAPANPFTDLTNEILQEDM